MFTVVVSTVIAVASLSITGTGWADFRVREGDPEQCMPRIILTECMHSCGDLDCTGTIDINELGVWAKNCCVANALNNIECFFNGTLLNLCSCPTYESNPEFCDCIGGCNAKAAVQE